LAQSDKVLVQRICQPRDDVDGPNALVVGTALDDDEPSSASILSTLLMVGSENRFPPVQIRDRHGLLPLLTSLTTEMRYRLPSFVKLVLLLARGGAVMRHCHFSL